MERTVFPAHRWRLILFAAGGIATAWLLRGVLIALGLQLLAASGLAAAAHPVCRQLEKKLPGGPSAALSILILLAALALAVMLMLPTAAGQFGVLTEALPALAETLQFRLTQFTAWLTARGIDLVPLRDGLMARLTEAAGGFVSRGMSMVTGLIGSLSKVLLSPLAAFYLLRDRRRISAWLTLLLPVKHRAQGVRAAREMKRETAAFLRGQLLLSLAVGTMTAAALAAVGVPGWLLLGVLMGVLELIPYIGPVIAGVPAVLLALQFGWAKALWTLAVIIVIQEIEGLILSPRLVGNATALHPLTVLLLVSAGGMLGGALGMVAVIPLVVSVRGAMRGWRE
nr:AI-2E family transporter [Clostridia bacterium]